ncbi:unnamed protein product [Clavelina lepadiformis]|uniref:Zinc ribbon domain-containing protein n=1 Tax=Clavelina lepadiformis TaxID=159417 RepID=A0ABP0F4Q3_CLALP
MNCVECHNEIPDIFMICSHCGHATTLDQDQIISEYFHSGYEYGEILQLLHSRHNYEENVAGKKTSPFYFRQKNVSRSC